MLGDAGAVVVLGVDQSAWVEVMRAPGRIGMKAMRVLACCARRATIADPPGPAPELLNSRRSWGGSSAGRASRSQCEGREFDPPPLHHTIPKPCSARPSERQTDALACVAEIDETTCWSHSRGRRLSNARPESAAAALRSGACRASRSVLVAGDRSGTTMDDVLSDSRRAAVMAVPSCCCRPMPWSALMVAARSVRPSRTGTGASPGRDPRYSCHRCWHIQNVNSYHGCSKAGCAASTASSRPTWRTPRWFCAGPYAAKS